MVRYRYRTKNSLPCGHPIKVERTMLGGNWVYASGPSMRRKLACALRSYI